MELVRYRGAKGPEYFQSQLEARYRVLFGKRRIPFEYEPVVLGPWHPDFVIRRGRRLPLSVMPYLRTGWNEQMQLIEIRPHDTLIKKLPTVIKSARLLERYNLDFQIVIIGTDPNLAFDLMTGRNVDLFNGKRVALPNIETKIVDAKKAGCGYLQGRRKPCPFPLATPQPPSGLQRLRFCQYHIKRASLCKEYYEISDTCMCGRSKGIEYLRCMQCHREY